MKYLLLLLLFLSQSVLAQEVTVAAAGDIACPPKKAATSESCQMSATSNLILNAEVVLNTKVDAVLALGDLQYPGGSSADFEGSYTPSWGRFKDKTYPAIGNHEYGSLGIGYFDYFGEVAGARDKGYYSFDLGAWHLVSLNSNCWAVGGCAENSSQGKWLQQDLAQSSSQCTLAFWHHPRFSSGPHGNDEEVSGLWTILANNKAELILNGHDHIYERFAPQLSDGTSSPDGIRQFTVGTGGVELYRIEKETPNREVVDDRNFGVLFLTLKEEGYTWKFVTIAGETLDEGKGTCR
jgi:acid phosphatase type 7